jgi:hypothetical protein
MIQTVLEQIALLVCQTLGWLIEPHIEDVRIGDSVAADTSLFTSICRTARPRGLQRGLED